MSILADPLTLAVLIVAVILLGMAKGGLAGVGALATPLAALVLPPATAAALLLPILMIHGLCQRLYLRFILQQTTVAVTAVSTQVLWLSLMMLQPRHGFHTGAA